ncbi:MAG: aminopeptidase P family N-terminal domain-containing protein, partial [Nitrospirae bacterium]|nr:aminopeptidase P family N-terminal domain-containing protein [Nitrospirota bacterium]
MNSVSRMKNIQKVVRLKKMDALYVSSIRNIRYLTGFTGSSGFVLITGDRGLFFTDFRYKEQAEAEVKGYELGSEKGRRIKALQGLIKKLGIKRLGFETSLSYGFYELLRRLPVALEPQRDLIENLRKIKDAEEIS